MRDACSIRSGIALEQLQGNTDHLPMLGITFHKGDVHYLQSAGSLSVTVFWMCTFFSFCHIDRLHHLYSASAESSVI